MSDKAIIIRRLQASDAAVYQQIRKCALQDVPQYVGPLAEEEAVIELAELESRMGNYEAEGRFVFGCFVDGECAGVSAINRSLNPRYSHKMFFSGLYILPAYRGRSIGRQLMEHRIEFARSLPGVRYAMLQVVTDNEGAHAIHRRFGFVSCGVEPKAKNIDGTYYDFETMQLDLYPDSEK